MKLAARIEGQWSSNHSSLAVCLWRQMFDIYGSMTVLNHMLFGHDRETNIRTSTVPDTWSDWWNGSIPRKSCDRAWSRRCMCWGQALRIAWWTSFFAVTEVKRHIHVYRTGISFCVSGQLCSVCLRVGCYWMTWKSSIDGNHILTDIFRKSAVSP